MAHIISLYNKKTGRKISCEVDQKKIMMKAGYHEDAEKAAEAAEALEIAEAKAKVADKKDKK